MHVGRCCTEVDGARGRMVHGGRCMEDVAQRGVLHNKDGAWVVDRGRVDGWCREGFLPEMAGKFS